MLQKKLGIKIQAGGGKTAVIPNLGCRHKWVDHYIPCVPKQDAGSAPELVWTLQEDKNFWLLPGIKPQFLSPTTSTYLLNMIFTAVKNSISYNSTIVKNNDSNITSLLVVVVGGGGGSSIC